MTQQSAAMDVISDVLADSLEAVAPKQNTIPLQAPDENAVARFQTLMSAPPTPAVDAPQAVTASSPSLQSGETLSLGDRILAGLQQTATRVNASMEKIQAGMPDVGKDFDVSHFFRMQREMLDLQMAAEESSKVVGSITHSINDLTKMQ